MRQAWNTFLKWRYTDAGRNALQKIAGAFCGVGFVIYVVPYTFYQENLKSWFHVYHAGRPLPIPGELEQKAQQVLEQVKLKDREKKLISFFHSTGFDVMHLGSTAISAGASIGLPKTFDYQEKADIDQHNIVIKDCSRIPWDEEVGSELMSAMVLTDAAKKFAIAREIFNVSYPTVYTYGGIVTAGMYVSVVLSQWGNTKYKMFKQPLWFRACWYSLTALFGLAVWVTMTDTFTLFVDKKCDELAADLGEDYVKGGIEYYEKRMLLNRSLRTLMKNKGENLYTPEGEAQSLRSKTLPLSFRLNELKGKLTNFEKD